MNKSAVTLALLSAFSPALNAALDTNKENKNTTEIITVVGSPITFIERESITPITNNQADFSDQLDTLPGVAISRNGPVTALIQYRGLFGERVGVSIDGVDINGAGPNAMDSPLSHVMPEIGMTATLYRGIVPVSAGVQTLGGKLDIQTMASTLFAMDEGVYAHINGSFISPGNGQQYQGNGLYRTDDGFISGAFIHQQRKNQESGSGDDIPNSHYQRNGAKIRAGYQIDRHQFDVSYQTLNTNESGTPALAMDINFIDAAWYRLGYRFDQSDEKYVSVNLFGNSNQHIMDNFSQRMLMMPTMARQNETDAIAQGIDLTYVQPWQSGELQLGFNFQHNRNNSVITNPNSAMFFINNFTNVERDTASVFAQWEHSTTQYQTTLGVRYSQIDMDAGLVGSSMAMMNDAVASLANNFNGAKRDKTYHMVDLAANSIFYFSKQIDIVVGASQKNRAPTYYERFTWLPLGITGGMADGFNYIGDLNLHHETARKLEFGIDYHNDDWTMSPRLFYQDIQDYIAGAPSTNVAANAVSTMMSGRTPFQWANTDAVIKGADITITGQLSEDITVQSVATIQHGNRDDIDDALFRIAPEQLTTHVQWHSTFYDAPISLQLTSEINGSQNHVSELQSEKPTAGYGLIHLSALWQLTPKLQITAKVNNAFDKEYAAHTAGINRVMNTTLPVGERVPNAGREWQLSISYHL
ncbi:MAG: TonB-dependent receptor [Alteromonas sp. Nap_26]|nr:MAG: TonB-dependent receptor [Alteromonas sp. Nap_26]